MKRLLLISSLLLAVLTIGAQQYRIPVSEEQGFKVSGVDFYEYRSEACQPDCTSTQN